MQRLLFRLWERGQVSNKSVCGGGGRPSAYQSLCSERRITRGLDDHNGSVDVHDGHRRDRAKLRAELLRLRREHVSVLVRLTWAPFIL